MKTSLLFLGLVLLCGCSGLETRRQEKASAYRALTPAQQQLVDRSQIEKGMDTNAVYIAWGKPSRIMTHPSAADTTPDVVWLYYKNLPVITPAWVYLPDQYGYWTLEYQPEHHSEAQLEAEVTFHQDRVVEWQRYPH